MKRRSTIMLFGLAGLLSCPPAPAAIRLEGRTGALVATEQGEVSLLDREGREKLIITGYRLAWAPKLVFNRGQSRIEVTEQEQKLIVDYHSPAEPETGIGLQGIFSCDGNVFQAEFILTGLPAENRPGGSAILYRLPSQISDTGVVKSTRWQASETGGIPYELADQTLYRFSDGKIAALVAPRSIRTNDNWFTRSQINCPPPD